MLTRLTGIDHPVIAVRNLEAAKRSYERLGFTLTPKGTHPQWGTANHCIMLPQGYVELLGLNGQGTLSGRLAEFLATREGLYRLALGSDDIEATRAALDHAGIKAGPVEELTRRLDDATLLKFRNADLAEDVTPGIMSFLCQHLTESAMRRPEWLSHPNGAQGLAGVTAVVFEPEAEVPAYEKFFGRGWTTMTDTTVAVHTGCGVILLSRHDEVTQLHPHEALDPAPVPPCLVALSLIVPDLEATAAYLSRQGVPFNRDGHGRLRVSPTETCGVLLEFVAPPPRPTTTGPSAA